MLYLARATCAGVGVDPAVCGSLVFIDPGESLGEERRGTDGITEGLRRLDP